MDNDVHPTGHQAHPLQSVPQAGDEKEDLGSWQEAWTLLTCTVLVLTINVTSLFKTATCTILYNLGSTNSI